MDELSITSVCVGQMAQFQLDVALQRPSMVIYGQKWGNRMIATMTKRVGRFVAPPLPNTGSGVYERLELCAQMLKKASDVQGGELMAMVLPMSLAKGFLKRGHCDDFVISPQLLFTQMETSPHFIMCDCEPHHEYRDSHRDSDSRSLLILRA
jgi:hypothetical protein